MKLKDTFYSQNGFVNTNYTRDRWLKIKGKFWRWASSSYMQGVYGIKIKPKHRHGRSITRRGLKRLCRCTLYELDWSDRSFQEMNFRTPYTMDCEWVKKHRIYRPRPRRKEGAK